MTLHHQLVKITYRVSHKTVFTLFLLISQLLELLRKLVRAFLDSTCSVDAENWLTFCSTYKIDLLIAWNVKRVNIQNSQSVQNIHFNSKTDNKIYLKIFERDFIQTIEEDLYRAPVCLLAEELDLPGSLVAAFCRNLPKTAFLH